jgi:tetratricopeptide (TPR) repeat protein
MRFRIGLALVLVGCAVPTAPPPSEPTKAPLEEMILGAESKARAASMRLVEQGRVELNQLHFERAAGQFGKAVEIDASNPFAYFYLGLTRFQTQRFSQAADFFRRSSDFFEKFPGWQAEAMAYRGECLERMNENDAARKAFHKAADADSNNLRARNGLSRLGE